MKVTFDHSKPNIIEAAGLQTKELIKKLSIEVPIQDTKVSKAIEKIVNSDNLSTEEKVIAIYLLGMYKRILTQSIQDSN